VPGAIELLVKLANVKGVSEDTSMPENAISFVAGNTSYYVLLDKEVDLESELEKLQNEKEYYEGFVRNVEKKLSNERFVQNAPEAVVEKERKKLSDGQAKIEQLQASIDDLKSR
jgi:valyl-tRNA synthetase